MHAMRLEVPLATEDPSIRKIETEEVAMTTAAQVPHVAVVADKQDTETAIAKDTARQNTTIVAAEVAVAVAAEVVVEIVIVAEMFRKVEKSLWKDYRWIWWKKTFDNSTPFGYDRCFV